MTVKNYDLIVQSNYLTYSEFLDQMEHKISDSNSALNENPEVVKLNYQRMKRLNRTVQLSHKLTELLSAISDRQTWVVITENWCGDSAQILPIIQKMTQVNSNLQLRIIERDENLKVMDLYRTNGGRSIPKLIIFCNEKNELLRWGPRPVSADKLVKSLREQNWEKDDIQKELHTWYARDRGESLQTEFINLFQEHIFLNQTSV